MDPGLKEAACSGDVEFLKQAVALQKPLHYFLSQSVAAHEYDKEVGNIFHLATINGKVEFVRVALEILPITIQQKQKLLSQRSSRNSTSLYLAARLNKKSDSFEIVQLILGAYKSLSDPYIKKPWLKFDGDNYTPLNMALYEANDDSAMQILLMDMELLCSTEDCDENSPLFLAVGNGCTKVAEKILMSSFSYSLCGVQGSTPLHFAPKCSENVLKLLLKKHPQLVDIVDSRGFNMLSKWVAITKVVWPFELLLREDFSAVRTKVFTDLIMGCTNEGLKNPLHLAAENVNNKIGRVIIEGYIKETMNSNDSNQDPPWKMKDSEGNTPLHIALYNRNGEFALYMLSVDSTLCEVLNAKGCSPLIIAVDHGCENVVEEILNKHKISLRMLHSYLGGSVLHFLSGVSEEIGKRLLEKFWWMINLPDSKGRTALNKAKARNCQWLISLLTEPSSIQKEPFDLISACENMETWAIPALIDNCEYIRKVYEERNDTPLHHIRFPSYTDYLIVQPHDIYRYDNENRYNDAIVHQFLELMWDKSIDKFKNATDLEGATPLHRALERKDMQFVKALLKVPVKQNIKDRHGKTAKSILAKLCKENDDWANMKKEINRVSPDLNTTYIKAETNVDQMRNTLSVVTALMATITFTAGFTLPGGLNVKEDSGFAILPRKAAFLVFLIADAYALCMSMMVLFCLIWSMVASSKKVSYELVDRSVFLLMQALYGTMTAFMSSIYTVMPQKYLWALIIVFVMCSIIAIALDTTLLHYLVRKLLPQTDKDLTQRLEKEKSSPSKIPTPSVEKKWLFSRSNQNLLLDEEEFTHLGGFGESFPMICGNLHPHGN